jgi:hypothetical protein
MLLGGLGIGLFMYFSLSAEGELKKVVGEIEAKEGKWRLEDLDADRPVIPEGRNAATRVLAATPLLPADWPNERAASARTSARGKPPEKHYLEDWVAKLPPEVMLDDRQDAELRAALDRAAAALAEARKLADLPEGRFVISYGPDPIATELPTQDIRRVVNLLRLGAILLAQANKADDALASCRAALNAGRSFDPPHSLVVQLVRIACTASALRTLERALAQGQPSAESLKAVQQLLEMEVAVPSLAIAVRGERGFVNRVMESLERGEVKSGQVLGSSGRTGSSFEDMTFYSLGGISMKRSHAWLLRWLTQVMEAAQLPFEEQDRRLKELEAAGRTAPFLARLLVPAVFKVAEACQRTQAALRCAVGALAAERFRKAHGRWPDSLAQLTPEFLQKPLLDPYDGKPLRYRRVGDGVVIYSVGPDGRDDGGKLDRNNPVTPGTDIGFRLWDVNKRRQAPPENAVDGQKDGK